MDDPLRRHWTSLVKTLTPSITRDLAHKAFERRRIAQSELHDILAPQDHRVTTNLLLVMGKRSRGALLEFARDLSNINLKDASIQNVGRRLLRDLGIPIVLIRPPNCGVDNLRMSFRVLGSAHL
jgi:hypothetical protein